MKTPYWQEKVLRPSPHAILAYEIYHNKLAPNEHDTIRALHELEQEDILESFIKSDFVWFATKGDLK